MKPLTIDQQTEIMKAQATLFYWVQISDNHFVNLGLADISSIKLEPIYGIWLMYRKDGKALMINPSMFVDFLNKVNFFNMAIPEFLGNQEKYNKLMDGKRFLGSE